MLAQRKNIRLKEYDYSSSGAYFITICTQGREMLFGKVIEDVMVVNEYGRIVADEIKKTNKLRGQSNIYITSSVVMPNHIHLIIVIDNSIIATLKRTQKEQFSMPTKQSIPTIIRSLKAAVTKRINEKWNGHGTPCPYKVWQPKFYDHVIRNEDEHQRICRYINTNPARWEDDCFYKPIGSLP